MVSSLPALILAHSSMSGPIREGPAKLGGECSNVLPQLDMTLFFQRNIKTLQQRPWAGRLN